MIRPARPDDDLASVHRAAFPTDLEARLVAELTANGHAEPSLVAEVDGRVVGHVVFSPVTLDPPVSLTGLGLAPVAVLPSHQNEGIGSALVSAGLAACLAMGVDFVVVLGHPPYYPRFGFRRADALGIGNEYGADESFMIVELREGCLRGVSGVAKYGAEFALFAGE